MRHGLYCHQIATENNISFSIIVNKTSTKEISCERISIVQTSRTYRIYAKALMPQKVVLVPHGSKVVVWICFVCLACYVLPMFMWVSTKTSSFLLSPVETGFFSKLLLGSCYLKKCSVCIVHGNPGQIAYWRQMNNLTPAARENPILKTLCSSTKPSLTNTKHYPLKLLYSRLPQKLSLYLWNPNHLKHKMMHLTWPRHWPLLGTWRIQPPVYPDTTLE